MTGQPQSRPPRLRSPRPGKRRAMTAAALPTAVGARRSQGTSPGVIVLILLLILGLGWFIYTAMETPEQEPARRPQPQQQEKEISRPRPQTDREPEPEIQPQLPPEEETPAPESTDTPAEEAPEVNEPEPEPEEEEPAEDTPPAITEEAEPQGITIEARHTHGVFYPGLKQQAVLQLKITGSPGDVISSLRFNLGNTSHPGDIAMARLCSSGSWNGYTFNTNRLAVEKDSTRPRGKNFSLSHRFELGSEPLYLWLSYDLKDRARRNGLIDARCTAVKTSRGVITPKVIINESLRKRRIGRVHRFPHRIVPYYRPRWVKGWGNAPKAVHLTEAHFKNFTDIVHFAYTVTAQGGIGMQWVGGGANATAVVNGALEEIKRLRGDSRSRILCGFGHMDGPMTSAVANPSTRRTLARNMANWAITRGYDGIDIDWEYPDSWDQWTNFGYFLADLREELAGSGLSISIASSVTYKVPTYWTTDQLDFIMTMSYDDLGEQHSSMRRFQGDAKKCVADFRMPKEKVVVGLPFYSNARGTLADQIGYAQIRNWYPRMRDDENFFHKKNPDGSQGARHSFNGPALIREKCEWAKAEGYGGVMIWAYDTDVPLTKKYSLARAVFSVMRQPKSGK